MQPALAGRIRAAAVDAWVPVTGDADGVGGRPRPPLQDPRRPCPAHRQGWRARGLQSRVPQDGFPAHVVAPSGRRGGRKGQLRRRTQSAPPRPQIRSLGPPLTRSRDASTREEGRSPRPGGTGGTGPGQARRPARAGELGRSRPLLESPRSLYQNQWHNPTPERTHAPKSSFRT